MKKETTSALWIIVKISGLMALFFFFLALLVILFPSLMDRSNLVGYSIADINSMFLEFGTFFFVVSTIIAIWLYVFSKHSELEKNSSKH